MYIYVHLCTSMYIYVPHYICIVYMEQVVVLDRNLYPPPRPDSAASDGPLVQPRPEIPAALRQLDECLLRAI